MAYKGLCVAVLLSFYEHTASSNKYVEMKAPVWDIAHPPCTLATPSMTYTNDGQEITETITFADSDELAVGYIQVPAAFENIGCIKQDDLDNLGYDKHHTVPSDPGECYSACNTNLFGIYDQDCYCFKETVREIDDNLNECDKKCDSPQKTVCGGKDDDGKTLISVYQNGKTCSHLFSAGHRPVNRTVGYRSTCNPVSQTCTWPPIFMFGIVPLKDNTKEKNNCRYVNLTAKTFLWNECSGTLYGICVSDRLRGTEELNWKEYTTWCYTNNMYPASEASFRNWTHLEDWWKAIASFLKPNFWIGQMKSWIVVDYRNWDSSLGSSFRYGYIKLNKDGKKTSQLMFTKKKPGRLLCLNGAGNDHDGKSVNGGLIATFVVVPIVVIATAIIVGFVIWKKRQRVEGTDTQCADNNLESDDQRHDYVVLEAPTEYATIKDESIANSAEAEYDITDMKNNTKHASPGDGNVYNTLRDQQEDMYNHTGNGAAIKKESGANNIGFQNTEDTYTHVVEDDAYSTNAQKQNRQQNVDDTYNTLK